MIVVFRGYASIIISSFPNCVLLLDWMFRHSPFDHLCNNYGSRTTPHEDNSPPNKNKAQPLPTRTTIPRTIPHQDNSPLGPLPRNKTTHQDQNLYGGELSSWGVVRIRIIISFVSPDYNFGFVSIYVINFAIFLSL